MTPPQQRRLAKQLVKDCEAIAAEARSILRSTDTSTADEIAISTMLFEGMASVRDACKRLTDATREDQSAESA